MGDHQIEVSHDNLYFVVGQIHSDVKKLLKADNETDKRLTKVERRQWMAAGFSACLGFFAAHFGLPHLP